MFWLLYESQNLTFCQYPYWQYSYQSYCWSWETGGPSSFLWSFGHRCYQITTQNLKPQNNIFKELTDRLEFFKSRTVWEWQKPLQASIFHKPFNETSHEAIKMIYGRFLIVSILNSSIKQYEGEIFSETETTQVPEELYISSSLHRKQEKNMMVQLHFRSYEHKVTAGQSCVGSFMASESNSAAASCILLPSDCLALTWNIFLFFVRWVVVLP